MSQTLPLNKCSCKIPIHWVYGYSFCTSTEIPSFSPYLPCRACKWAVCEATINTSTPPPEDKIFFLLFCSTIPDAQLHNCFLAWWMEVVLRLDEWHFNFPELPPPRVFPKKETPQMSTLSTSRGSGKVSQHWASSLCLPPTFAASTPHAVPTAERTGLYKTCNEQMHWLKAGWLKSTLLKEKNKQHPTHPFKWKINTSFEAVHSPAASCAVPNIPAYSQQGIAQAAGAGWGERETSAAAEQERVGAWRPQECTWVVKWGKKYCMCRKTKELGIEWKKQR